MLSAADDSKLRHATRPNGVTHPCVSREQAFCLTCWGIPQLGRRLYINQIAACKAPSCCASMQATDLTSTDALLQHGQCAIILECSGFPSMQVRYIGFLFCHWAVSPGAPLKTPYPIAMVKYADGTSKLHSIRDVIEVASVSRAVLQTETLGLQYALIKQRTWLPLWEPP